MQRATCHRVADTDLGHSKGRFGPALRRPTPIDFHTGGRTPPHQGVVLIDEPAPALGVGGRGPVQQDAALIEGLVRRVFEVQGHGAISSPVRALDSSCSTVFTNIHTVTSRSARDSKDGSARTRIRSFSDRLTTSNSSGNGSKSELVEVVDEICDFLEKLSAGLLVVELYVVKALALADKVFLLSRGRVVLAGEPSEIEGTDIFARYLGAEAIGDPAGLR